MSFFSSLKKAVLADTTTSACTFFASGNQTFAKKESKKPTPEDIYHAASIISTTVSQASAVKRSVSDYRSSHASKPCSHKAESKDHSLQWWDARWEYIGKLKDASLTPYSHYVGLYRHVVNGETVYVGRALELTNGGLRKRLRDYVRESGSARTHTSGRTINQNLDSIETYVLPVGSDEEAVELTKELEKQFIRHYNPRWNKQHPDCA